MRVPDYMGVQGHKIYLLDPKPEDFQPYRTAFSLSHEHRYAGSYGPYSVAQHSVLVAEHVRWLRGTPLQQLAALYHDATEQVTGDIPSPVKVLCPDLQALERRLEAAVNERFGVNVRDPLVKQADMAVFAAEVRWLIPEQYQGMYQTDGPCVLPPEKFIFWSPDKAMKKFLAMHEGLVEEL
jgi:hypothetical protein